MMRRVLIAAAVAAGTVGLASVAAFAITPTVSYSGLPSGWSGTTIECALATQVPATVTHVTGPATPPLGTGSLEVTESDSTTMLEIGSAGPALSTVTAFSAGMYEPTNGVLNAQLAISATDGATTYLLLAPDPVRGSWQTVDATKAILDWTNYNTAAHISNGTLAQFETAHPGATLGSLWIMADPQQGCGTGTFYVDAVHYNVSGAESLIDFEAVMGLANGPHPASVLTGQSVTLSATLTRLGRGAQNQSVTLWARPLGASSYSLLKTVVTNSNGRVSDVVAPTVTTTYQWRFAGHGDYTAVNAFPYSIITRQRVVVTSKPTVVPYRGYAQIKGRVTPFKAGVTVRLERILSSRAVAIVATARTTTGGYFAIKAPMTVLGLRTYVVVALGYTGEAAGESSTFQITTR